jgi:spartin
VANKGNRAANAVAGGIADISIKVADSIVKRMGPTRYGEQLADPASRTNAAREVAAAAVVAAVGVYDSMEQAARIVLTSGGDATSQFIGHKYGAAAGDVTKDAAHAAVTTGLTVVTVQKIGVKKVARRIAKRTATGLAKAHILGPNKQGTPAITGNPPHQQHPATNTTTSPFATANSTGPTATPNYSSPFSNAA